MSWNYRVVKRTFEDETDGENITFSIHEAYYVGEIIPTSITEEGIAPMGTTIEELKADYDLQRKAFEKPILNYEDFWCLRNAI